MSRGGRQPAREAGPSSRSSGDSRSHPGVQMIEVARIRPEEGLSRRRDRAGHRELCDSIRQFGVLTPISVRRAPDNSGDYMLVKGQGRTLACRVLGLDSIPAILMDDDSAETEKVQQFLVENVARLRMRPVDRALLVAHARSRREETSEVARRFGISSATVRKLQSQLDGASSGEIAALRSGHINLALHAVIARHVAPSERVDVIRVITTHGLRAQEVDQLFAALGWKRLEALGPTQRRNRLVLLAWCCSTLAALPKGKPRDRITDLAHALPEHLDVSERRATR